MKRTLFAVLFSATLAFAQGTKYAGSYLEIPVGARAPGLGDAFVSLADDGSAFHYNPSGSALVNEKLLTLMYSSQYGSLVSPLSDFYFIGYTQPIQDLSVSVDWVRLSVDNIPFQPDLTVYDSPAQRELLVKSGTNSGTFGSADDAFYLNISKLYTFNVDLGWLFFKIPIQLPVGLNFKIIHRSLNDRVASGFGLDGGFMLRFPVGPIIHKKSIGSFSFGMNIRDATDTRIAWDTQRTEVVPRSLVWGGSLQVPVQPLAGDVVIALNRDSKYGDFLIGGEYVYKRMLSVRAGSDATNLTAGVGIDLDFLHVDYAFLSQGLGNVNRVSVSFYPDRIFK